MIMRKSTFNQTSIRLAAVFSIFLMSLSASANTDPFSGKFFDIPEGPLNSNSASAVISEGQNTLETRIFVSQNSDSSGVEWKLRKSIFERNEP
jgi:hypothetical protein